MKKYFFHWQTLLTGIIYSMSFAFMQIPGIASIALIGWFYRLKLTKTNRETIKESIWLSVFISIFGFYFVFNCLHGFLSLSILSSCVVFLIFGLVCQPQFFILSVLQKKICIQSIQSNSKYEVLSYGLLTAFLYTGIDWLVPKIFAETLGYTFSNANYLSQIADLGGVSLITFIAVLINFCLWMLLEKKQQKMTIKPIVSTAIFTVLLLIASFIYGSVRINKINQILQRSNSKLNLSIIQANVEGVDKLASENGVIKAVNEVTQKLYNASIEATKMNPKPDAIVWPETSFPAMFQTPRNETEKKYNEQLRYLIYQIGVPFLFGGYDRQNEIDYNSFFSVFPNPDKKSNKILIEQIYRKNKLMPFGEYIPGMDSFPDLRNAFKQVGNFGRGPGPQTLTIPKNGNDIKFNPIICYEAEFPNYNIKGARLGSKLIVNVTNDEWFGSVGEPELHLQFSRFRSIETRLPQIRATNTGYSGNIDQLGNLIYRSEINKYEVIPAQVTLTEEIPTLMKKWGDWFAPFALIISAILLIISRAKLFKN